LEEGWSRDRGPLRFKSAVERPLKRCTLTALATVFRELDQSVVLFLTLSLKTGGIIHVMPYSKEGNFP
ncbi:MAG: hypothetical protein ACRESL_26285, partial [Pseudomonas sp.]